MITLTHFIPKHKQICYVIVAILLSSPISGQVPYDRLVNTERELFHVLEQVNPDNAESIHNLLLLNHQHVTPQLWRWLATQAAFFEGAGNISASFHRNRLALIVAVHLNNRLLEADSKSTLGHQLSARGEHRAAIEAFNSSIQAYLEAGNHTQCRLATLGLSQAYLRAGDQTNARELATEIISRLTSGGTDSASTEDMFPEATALSVLAEIDYLNELHRDAIQKYQRVLDIYEHLHSTSLPVYNRRIASTLICLGRLHSLIGYYNQALLFLNRSLEIIAGLPSPCELQREAVISLGAHYLRQDNYERAQYFTRQALDLCPDQPNIEVRIVALLNLGLVDLRQGNINQALNNLRSSQALAYQHNSIENIITTSQHIGYLLSVQGNHQAALDELSRVEKLAIDHKRDIRLAEILSRKAYVLLSLKRAEKAITVAQEVKMLAARMNQHRLEYTASLIIAKCYVQKNEPLLAIQTIERSNLLLEESRDRIAGTPLERQQFFSNRVEGYKLLVQLLAEQNKPELALQYADRIRGRILYDLLPKGYRISTSLITERDKLELQELERKITELNRLIRNEQAHTAPNPTKLGELQARLQTLRQELSSFKDALFSMYPELRASARIPNPLASISLVQLLGDPQTAHLEYVVSEHQTILLLVVSPPGKGINIYTLPIKIRYDELNTRVSKLHRLLSQRHPAYREESRYLYNLLIKPAENYLQQVKTICILPDESLWNLPFQALLMKENKFLIEDHCIYYAQSLGILGEQMWQHKPSDTRERTGFLAFGNPRIYGNSNSSLKLSHTHPKFDLLPDAETEIHTIGKLFAEQYRALYLGSAATEARFKAEAANFGIIHFATHGVIDNLNPLYSYLLLTSDDNDGEDGLLEAREILDLNLRADTVVLSACETARGRIGAGEGVIGMTWAFFAAGARTAVVSQWKVDSAATSDLMINFYRRFSQGANKAEAMREASLALLKDPRYHHPFYWASFIVVGSDR